MRGVLRERTDQRRQITGFDILRPGRTLREFGMLATHGYTRKDRNMAFREAQILRVGKALREYDREPMPDWCTDEFYSRRRQIDPTETDLARVLYAAISYLVEHDWTEEVPAVGELPAIVAEFTGTPAELTLTCATVSSRPLGGGISGCQPMTSAGCSARWQSEPAPTCRRPGPRVP